MTLSLNEGSAAEVALAGASPALRAMLASEEYGRLHDDEKPHLKARLAMMERIDAAPKKQPAIEAEALRQHAGERYSEGAIRKAYYQKWAGGGRRWQDLINRARVPDEAAGLDPAMVLKWHQVFFRKSGRGRAAHRELQRLWRAGDHFPGFPAQGRTKHLPPRLSYANLMRGKYKPTAVVKRVARIGLGAAHDLLPGVLQTRVGMRPGSFLLFDDIWLDLYCSVPKQFGMRRVLQFHAMELLSGDQIGRGMKPEILGDDGRMERLKEREMLFLFAHVLGNRGYNPEGCLCVMELGTATVPERIVRLLHDFTGGKLRVEKGSTKDHPLAQGLYAGRAKGNFKIKAALESSGNLIHNESGDRLLLPAQSGNLARLNEPEDLHGRKQHLDQLQRAALLVPREMRDLVVRNVTPPFAQVAELLDLIQERINHFEEHALEGWEACGFMAPLFRLSLQDDWKLQTALQEYPAPVRAAIEESLRQDPRLTTCRRMSRHEVYVQRVQPHLVTLPPHLIPEILGQELAEERRVGKDGRFHFEDANLDGAEHHYEGVAVDAEGRETALQDGETYATFVSMLDPHWMHVCDARGRYLGKAPRTIVPTRGDAEGYARACGQRAKAARERLVPVLRAAAPLMRRDAEAAEQATDLLAQLGQEALQEKRTQRQDATALLLARQGGHDDEA
ncbi:MAG: hypothetical protein HZC55_04205 [Verrucomicrobia bacterium]|nr:hypothetical protein [Verrucomicrobiota bacterium]